MMHANVGGITDPLKQDLGLQFCRKQNYGIRILTKTHINHDQIHQIRNNWLGPIFFSPENSHTKVLIPEIHVGLEGVTDVDTDPKGGFLSFRVTLFNNRVLCVFTTSGHSTREQLVRGRFFEELNVKM